MTECTIISLLMETIMNWYYFQLDTTTNLALSQYWTALCRSDIVPRQRHGSIISKHWWIILDISKICTVTFQIIQNYLRQDGFWWSSFCPIYAWLLHPPRPMTMLIAEGWESRRSCDATHPWSPLNGLLMFWWRPSLLQMFLS